MNTPQTRPHLLRCFRPPAGPDRTCAALPACFFCPSPPAVCLSQIRFASACSTPIARFTPAACSPQLLASLQLPASPQLLASLQLPGSPQRLAPPICSPTLFLLHTHAPPLPNGPAYFTYAPLPHSSPTLPAAFLCACSCLGGRGLACPVCMCLLSGGARCHFHSKPPWFSRFHFGPTAMELRSSVHCLQTVSVHSRRATGSAHVPRSPARTQPAARPRSAGHRAATCAALPTRAQCSPCCSHLQPSTIHRWQATRAAPSATSAVAGRGGWWAHRQPDRPLAGTSAPPGGHLTAREATA